MVKMKKTVKVMLIGAVALMLLLPNSSLAKGITGGLKIGMNSAKLHGEDIKEMEEELGEELKSKWGLCAGGFIRFNISETFAIQPEVLYTMKGGKFEETIDGETMKFEMNFSYLEIPVLLKLTIPTPGGIKPSLFAGPALAIKLSGKEKLVYAGETIEEEDIEEMKDTDFGLIIGAGVDFWNLTVDLRYVLGLNTFSTEEDVDAKHGVISLIVGYSF